MVSKMSSSFTIGSVAPCNLIASVLIAAPTVCRLSVDQIPLIKPISSRKDVSACGVAAWAATCAHVRV
jgi:hypothetical protein